MTTERAFSSVGTTISSMYCFADMAFTSIFLALAADPLDTSETQRYLDYCKDQIDGGEVTEWSKGLQLRENK